MEESTKGRKGAIKHNFYVNKMKPCLKCPKQKDGTCPYFFEIKGKEYLHEFMFDDFGVNRCVPEFQYFINLKKTFKEEYKISDADEPLLEKMCMIMVRAARVEEYLADEGLVHIRKFKDEKTGEVHEGMVQNLLKKDAYFDDKMLREWLDNLKISRNSREQIKDDEDIALILTSTKTMKIKGTRDPKKVSEMIESAKDIQAKLSTDIQEN